MIFAYIIMISCGRNYIYIDEISNILGSNIGECIEKYQTSSESIGEWYICETYKFEKNGNSTPIHNTLYFSDTSWDRKDWVKLPIDSTYLEVQNIIFNYYGTNSTKAISGDVEKLNNSGCGYYSFLAKPSIKYPTFVIMFMVDTNNMKLYIIDVHS